MTIEKFYETLKFILDLDAELEIQPTLESIGSTLTNLVSAPSQPQHQSRLATALEKFAKTSDEMRSRLTPTISSSIAELGGEEFFNPNIAESVQASISANAMTPSVAKEFVDDLEQGVRSSLRLLNKRRKDCPNCASLDQVSSRVNPT